MKSLLSRCGPYWELMRFHRPVGTLLLLWPTLLALWLAAGGPPPLKELLIFVAGVVLMRACGCVINDYADRGFDAHVERTRSRPLATGAVSPRAALLTFSVLALLAFALVLRLNFSTVLLSFGALAIASAYPYMKRHTYWPQLVLGAAFAWAIPMAFMALQNRVPPLAWLLYLSTLLWVLAYDTLYGMVDRADDLKIGIKSTAVLFGRRDLHMVGAIHALALLGFFCTGLLTGLGLWALLGWCGATMNALWQMRRAASRKGEDCFTAFRWNNYYGLMLSAGVMLDYLLAA